MHAFLSLNHPERGGKIALRPTNMVVVGGSYRRGLRSESESISSRTSSWFSRYLAGLPRPSVPQAFASAPAERLRCKRSVFSAYLPAVAATLTFMLLDLIHWRRDFDEKARKQMETLQWHDGNFAIQQKRHHE